MIFDIDSSDILDISPGREPLGKCKKCGKLSPAKDFQVDDNLGVMVCKNCFNSPSKSLIKKEEKKIDRPVEKEVIPKTIVINKEEDVFRKIDRPEREKKRLEQKQNKEMYKRITCDRCGFKFRYNERKNWPSLCPSCGENVSGLKKGMLF